MAAALSGTDLSFAYFRLPSVRSADNLATKAAPHQLEPGPKLIAVWLVEPPAVGSLVKALQSPLLRVGVVVTQIEREHLPGEA